MSESVENGSRFLPSRVFRRWRKVALIGGLVVPLVVLGWGGFVLYITPRKYESRVRFEMLGREPETAAVIVCSQKAQMRINDALDLSSRFDTDSGAIVKILGKTMEAEVIGGNVVEVTVRAADAGNARDIAMEAVKSLRDHLLELESEALNQRLDRLDQEIRQQQSHVEEMAAVYLQAVETLGEDPELPAERRQLETLRKKLERGDETLAWLENEHARGRVEGGLMRQPLVVHAEPVLARGPVEPDLDVELARLWGRVLVLALVLGAGLPFLLELCVLPRGAEPRLRAKADADGAGSAGY